MVPGLNIALTEVAMLPGDLGRGRGRGREMYGTDSMLQWNQYFITGKFFMYGTNSLQLMTSDESR